MKRRDTFRMIPLSLAGLALTGGAASAQNRKFSGHSIFRSGMGKGMGQGPGHDFGNGPTGMTYIEKVTSLLRDVRQTQSENILEASYAVARTIESGRTCWSNWDHGHTNSADAFPDRNGDPGFITIGYDPKKAKNGDCFMGSFPCSEEILSDLAKKDIVVIGAPAPVSGDCIGAENNIPSVRANRLRPLSDIWIQTGITSVGALVRIPGSPAPLGPASGPLYLTLWWMIYADACRILSRNGKKFKVKGDEPALTGSSVSWADLNSPLMDDYFDTTLRQMEMLGSEMGDIRRMADMAADTLIEGGDVYFYSRYQESLATEAYHRRGGFGFPEAAYDGSINGKRGDMVIMGISKPDDAADLANLKKFREHGMKTASLGPSTRGHKTPEGETVPKGVDVHVGRVCDTYGLFAIPGFDQKVCPTSGIITVAANWMMSVELAMAVIRKTGNTPGIHFSGSLLWGGEHNTQMRGITAERGY